jgi:arylsulfatase A-like enzyme/Tfp pilus assembly protein PilF
VRRRSASRTLATGALLLALNSISLAPGCNRIGFRPGPPPDAKSVVLVTIDTLRADHVGAYGASFAETPTLDALARAGVRFETAIAAAPITLPSHASLLTGMDPPAHGVRHNGTFKLAPELTTLAERFQAGGWATGAFVGAVVLKARYGLDQGFDVYDDEIRGEKAAPGGFAERPAVEVVDAALAWLARSEGPFFLWVHLYDPHMDYKAPEAFARRFPDRPYDAEIAYADYQVGRLLAALREQGRLADTLVVATADHGESLGEHGEATHSMALYDAVLAVPLIVAGPGLPAGRVVPGVVRAKDLAPTVLAQVGLDPLPEAKGEDLSPRMLADAGGAASGTEGAASGVAPTRAAYAETLATLLDNGWAPLHAIRTDHWLYVRAPRPELYDVARDPRQLDNLVKSDPARARPHQAELDALISSALAGEKQAATLELDDETRAQLHALGYAVADVPVAATGIDPKDGLRWLPLLHQAMGAYEAGDTATAEKLFLEVTEKLPASARAHSQLASIYYQEGRQKRALEHADLAISYDPRTPLHHAVRAEILLSLGRVEDAREAYRQAAAIDAESPWSQVGLQWEALARGDRKAAERHARKAMEDDPGNTGVFLRIAALWSEYGEYERAVAVLEEALRASPQAAFARMRLAIEYARTGKGEAALAEREQAGRYATSARLGTALGRAFAAAGDFERADWQLRQVLERHPDDAFARESLERVEAWRAKLGPSGRS